jgi:hypothetical protein
MRHDYALTRTARTSTLDACGASNFPSVQPERILVASGVRSPRPSHAGCARARSQRVYFIRGSIYRRSVLHVVPHQRETPNHISAPSALLRRSAPLAQGGHRQRRLEDQEQARQNKTMTPRSGVDLQGFFKIAMDKTWMCDNLAYPVCQRQGAWDES